MVDPIKIVREWLLASLPVINLLGTNANESIYGGPDYPEHFDPKLGPAILISVATGRTHSEIKQYITPKVKITVTADVEQGLQARQVFGAIFDTLHLASGVTFGDDGTVLAAEAGGTGSDWTDPDNGWSKVHEFFQIQMIQTSLTPNLPPIVIDGGTFDSDD